jgi:hypothetical protein
LDIPNDNFLKKIGSGRHSNSKFGQRGGGVTYINARKKRFWKAILACVLLRQNLQNSVSAHSTTKIPLDIYDNLKSYLNINL